MSIHRHKMQHIPQHLTRILLGDKESVCEASTKLIEQDHWYPTVNLASNWRVIPQLYQRVDAFRLDIDSNSKNYLSNLNIASTAQSMFIMHSCSMVLEYLNAHDLPALAIKGVGLIGNLYDHPSQRMINDADLLTKDLNQTYMILKSIGMSPDIRLSHPERNSLCLVSKEGVQIDLHTDPFFDSILSRAETVRMRNITVRAVNPVDSMTLTVSHVLRDNFAPFSTVKDLYDLAMWWTVQHKRWKIDDMIEQMQLHGVLEPCFALWQILAHLDAKTPAQKGITRLRHSLSQRQLQNSIRLEELFNYQLRNGLLHTHLVRALASPSSTILYIISRIRNDEKNRRIFPLSREFFSILLREAFQFAREITNLNSESIKYVSALRRAHATYDSSNSRKYATT